MEDPSDIIPDTFKALRACMVCSLVKTFGQFHESGCQNCEFLNMEGNTTRVHECTTAYFEGVIAMIDPSASWVAKWQRIGKSQPGMYAITMSGDLPDDVVETCENMQIECKINAKLK